MKIKYASKNKPTVVFQNDHMQYDEKNCRFKVTMAPINEIQGKIQYLFIISAKALKWSLRKILKIRYIYCKVFGKLASCTNETKAVLAENVFTL